MGPTSEPTLPTQTPPSTLNTRTFSTTTMERARQAEVPSSDGSFLLLLSEEEPPPTSCNRTPLETRRLLSSARTREPWHKRCSAVSFHCLPTPFFVSRLTLLS